MGKDLEVREEGIPEARAPRRLSESEGRGGTRRGCGADSKPD